MKQKRAYRNITPLDVAFSLWADGGALIQSYNADTNTFMPNREITPLYIRPKFEVADKDGIVRGNKLPQITNINWYETKNGIRKVIASDNSNYVITRDNTNYNGSIAVVKNHIAFSENVTLEFNGTYLDTRNNTTIQLIETVLLRTIASAEAPLMLKLDCGNLVKHNPIEYIPKLTIGAQMFLGSKLITVSTKQKFWWYKVNDNKTEELITGSNVLHIWYLSGAGSQYLTIDKENIYQELKLRCKAEYYTGTAPSSPTANALISDVIIIREYPKWEEDILTADELGVNVKSGYMEAEISTAKGVITNPSKYFFIKFFTKKVQSGAAYTEVGHGNNASYDASLIDSSTGQAVDLAIEVKEHTGYDVLTDKDGNVLTDKDGNVLIGF